MHLETDHETPHGIGDAGTIAVTRVNLDPNNPEELEQYSDLLLALPTIDNFPKVYNARELKLGNIVLYGKKSEEEVREFIEQTCRNIAKSTTLRIRRSGTEPETVHLPEEPEAAVA